MVAAREDSSRDTNNNFDVKGDNEIHFLGKMSLDNGATIGIKAELEAGGHSDQSSDPIDKAFVWVEGRFGKFELGTDYNAASLLHVAAPDAAGLWNGPSNGLMSDTVIARPAAVSTMYSGNQTELDHDDNAEKIIYFTPAWNGLTLGVSFTPTSQSEDNRLPTGRSELFAAGLGYIGEVGGISVELSAGWLRGDLATGSATPRDRVEAVSLGAQGTLGGVTVAGSFGRELHRYAGRVASATSVDNSGRSWDLGVQYAFGQTALSAAVYRSEVKGLVLDPGTDRITVVQVSARYTLGPGVTAMGSAGHISYEDEGAGGNDNRGVGVLSGLGLAF